MNNDTNSPKKKNEDASIDTIDSLENALRKSESDDPLAAVKNMRLQQLAACRIKTAKELDAKMSQSEKDKIKEKK